MVQKTPSRDLDKVIVRLPDGMRDRLAQEAKANNRSMNAEIVSRLDLTLRSHNFASDATHIGEFIKGLEFLVEHYKKNADVFGVTSEGEKLIEKELKRTPSKSKRQGVK